MSTSPDPPSVPGLRRRRLRAVLAADVANFTGLVSINETSALDAISMARSIAREELAEHSGWLFGMPGDGIFALFESAVDAVRCALDTQVRLAEAARLGAVRFRIGIHLGEVLFEDEAPFGESLVIAARLEALAEPGAILVSEAVRDAVAPRISATFSERGVFSLKNSPRRVNTFTIAPLLPGELAPETLDHTVMSKGHALRPPEPPHAPPREYMPLPKAPQLVVKPAEPRFHDATPPDPAPEPVPVIAEPKALAPACLESLTLHLTTHLGPVARVLVKRCAVGDPEPKELIERLAREIPAAGERQAFIATACSVLARAHRL